MHYIMYVKLHANFHWNAFRHSLIPSSRSSELQ